MMIQKNWHIISSRLYSWFLWGLSFWLLPVTLYARPQQQSSYGGQEFVDSSTEGQTLVPDVTALLVSLQDTVKHLNLFISSFAYLSGFTLVFFALFKLKESGAGAGRNPNQDFRGPLVSIFTGSALIFMPTFINSILATVYGTNVITAYNESAGDWTQAINTLVKIVNFVGAVSIVRGLLHFHKAGQGQAQDSFARGLIHLVAGAIALNIVQAKNILAQTFSMSF